MSDVASSPRLNRLLGGFAAFASLGLPIGVMAVPASQTAASITPPGRDAAAIVVRAGGTVLRLGGWSNVLVVRAGSSDLVDRLSASGAWLVVDARFAAVCMPASQS